MTGAASQPATGATTGTTTGTATGAATDATTASAAMKSLSPRRLAYGAAAPVAAA